MNFGLVWFIARARFWVSNVCILVVFDFNVFHHDDFTYTYFYFTSYNQFTKCLSGSTKIFVDTIQHRDK